MFDAFDIAYTVDHVWVLFVAIELSQRVLVDLVSLYSIANQTLREPLPSVHFTAVSGRSARC